MKLFFLIMVLSTFAYAEKPKSSKAKTPPREESAHRHGVGELGIVFNGLNGRAEIRISSESIFGFEHRAVTEKDQNKMKEGLAKLQEKMSEMLVLDPSLNCKINPDRRQVSYEGGEEIEDAKKRKTKTPEHSETLAVFLISCAKSPVGTDVVFKFHSVFPKIKSIDVQFIADGMQKYLNVKKNKSVLTLKN